MSSLVCIHQPDFLPWLGFYNKVLRCHQAIIFDSVAISGGKSWSTRVKILLNGKEHWLTMPIKKKGSMGQKLCFVEMIEPERNWKKMLGTLKQAYSKSEFYCEVIEFLEEVGPEGEVLLAEFCLKFVKKSIARMGFVGLDFQNTSNSVSLMASGLGKTELIVQVCKEYGVTSYLSGEGCLSFLDQQSFSINDIDLQFQGFEHPVYSQIGNSGPFVPGLSIIDCLMNNGFEGTKRILESSFRN